MDRRRDITQGKNNKILTMRHLRMPFLLHLIMLIKTEIRKDQTGGETFERKITTVLLFGLIPVYKSDRLIL